MENLNHTIEMTETEENPYSEEETDLLISKTPFYLESGWELVT